jgi:hypothetical protein
VQNGDGVGEHEESETGVGEQLFDIVNVLRNEKGRESKEASD